MAWSESRIFDRFLMQALGNNLAYDLDADSTKAVLYNNTGTPDATVATDVLMSYNGAASQWVIANEVSQGAGTWEVGGRAMSGMAQSLPAGHTWMYDATDTASGAATTLANVFGTLVIDSTVGTISVGCYNYFGGTNSVTNGVFTIVWHTNGLMRITL